jgi:hypothetical protein
MRATSAGFYQSIMLLLSVRQFQFFNLIGKRHKIVQTSIGNTENPY